VVTGRNLEWTTATLQPGDTETVSYTVTVTAPNGTITNTAEIGGQATNTVLHPITPTYLVTYFGNSHTSGSAPAQQSHLHGTTHTIQNQASLVRAGYSFLGWSENPNALTPSYTPASTIASVQRNYNLYAVWQQNTVTPTNYTVSYVAGATGVTGLPGSATVGAGSSYTVSSAVPQRAGYSFSGWARSVGGTYFGGNSFVMPAQNVILTALWSSIPLTYTVSYDGGATGVSGLPANGTYSAGDSVTVGSAPTRTGYTFTGWSSSTGGTLQPGATFVMPAANVTLTALWDETPTSFTVTYVGGASGVSGLPANGTYSAGDTVTVGGAPTRTGFTFTGWSSSTGGTLQPGATFVMPAADVTLTAQWEPVVVPPTEVEPGSGDPEKVFEEAVALQNIPIIGVPLYGPSGFGAWSLVDLILAVLGILLALAFAIRVLTRKREDDEEDNNDNAYYTQTQEQREQQADKVRKARRTWLILALAFAIINVLVFILTQDMRTPMVLVDWWTIVMLIIFIVEIVALRFVFKKAKKDDKDDQPRDEVYA
jgi:uncharacterized repeat protein (TIGR02543 family)